MLSSAELAGNLDVVLTQLADYMERDADARGKVTAAMIYPSVVLGMSIVTFVVLGVFVMPRFKMFFQSLHATLPLPTRMLISVTNFIESEWYILFAGHRLRRHRLRRHPPFEAGPGAHRLVGVATAGPRGPRPARDG